MSPPASASALPDAVPAWQRLRAETREAHAAVEALPTMAVLMSGTLSREDYADVLRRHFVLLAAWEARYHDWLQGLASGWRYAWRTPRLRDDLQRLGIDAVPGPRAAVPRVPSAAERWGMLYVVEGSALGGRLIARHVRARLPELDGALSYFDPPAAPAWREFQQRLQAALPGAAAQRLAVAGARTMFSSFHRHLAHDAR